MLNTQLSEEDKKIPKGLVIKYQNSWYILKAGLEWKAVNLFGVDGYSLTITPHTIDHEMKVFIFQATLTVIKSGATFSNFGEATLANTSKQMTGQMLHLASTRAECRVLRMATACGYASYDEVITNGEEKIIDVDAEKPVTEMQLATIKSLGGKADKEMSQAEAREIIKNLSK